MHLSPSPSTAAWLFHRVAHLPLAAHGIHYLHEASTLLVGHERAFHHPSLKTLMNLQCLKLITISIKRHG